MRPLVGFEDLHDEPHHGDGGVELAALLEGELGELAEEVLVHAPEDVALDVVGDGREALEKVPQHEGRRASRRSRGGRRGGRGCAARWRAWPRRGARRSSCPCRRPLGEAPVGDLEEPVVAGVVGEVGDAGGDVVLAGRGGASGTSRRPRCAAKRASAKRRKSSARTGWVYSAGSSPVFARMRSAAAQRSFSKSGGRGMGVVFLARQDGVSGGI
jgi:hypothetical protein